jgi:hypothetical protein
MSSRKKANIFGRAKLDFCWIIKGVQRFAQNRAAAPQCCCSVSA